MSKAKAVTRRVETPSAGFDRALQVDPGVSDGEGVDCEVVGREGAALN